MCAPYRAQTKGKVERFIQYLKHSFVWPLESRLKGQGIILDADIADAHVGAWLRDVANSRIHAETKAQPIERFVPDAAHLLSRSPVWTEPAPAIPADLRNITVPQHDLEIYDAIGGVA